MRLKIDNASKNTQNSKPLIRNAWLLALLLLILALKVIRSVELLNPRLLDDREKMKRIFRGVPRNQYKISNVAGLKKTDMKKNSDFDFQKVDH